MSFCVVLFLAISLRSSSDDAQAADLSSSCSISIDQAHQWSLTNSTENLDRNHRSLSTIVQDIGKTSHFPIISSRILDHTDEGSQTSKMALQQQEYETQLVHNIILNLLKRRYELHTVHEKKDKVRPNRFPHLSLYQLNLF